MPKLHSEARAHYRLGMVNWSTLNYVYKEYKSSKLSAIAKAAEKKALKAQAMDPYATIEVTICDPKGVTLYKKAYTGKSLRPERDERGKVIPK